MWFNTKARDSITIVQRAIAGIGADPGRSLIAAVDDISRHERWRGRQSAQGIPFASFGEFGLEQQPIGLGVNDNESFWLLRCALVKSRRYGELADLIDLCAREQGRPRENFANGEHFIYKVPTSYNTIDRILLTLKRKHEPLLEEVRAGNLKPRQAAIRAGFVVPPTPKLRFGAFDFDKAKGLPKKAQADMLCEVFRALSVDAQCALLNRCVDPVLGSDLARQWREKHRTGSGGE